MAVTLDAPTDPPTWKVACVGDCGRRLYVVAATGREAAERAQAYGWVDSAIGPVCIVCFRRPWR